MAAVAHRAHPWRAVGSARMQVRSTLEAFCMRPSSLSPLPSPNTATVGVGVGLAGLPCAQAPLHGGQALGVGGSGRHAASRLPA